MSHSSLQKQPFKAKAYKRVIDQLKILPPTSTISSMDDLAVITGIGPSIKKKIQEILETGKLVAADRVCDSASVYKILNRIHGIGPKTAKDLMDQGITSIEELKIKAASPGHGLNEKQLIGIKYYDDLIQRIPQKTMNKHNEFLHKCCAKLQSSQSTGVTVVGSYRRKAADSGDIDVLLNTQISTNTVQVLEEFITILRNENYICDDGTLACGSKKYMGIVKLGKGDSTARRLDVLVTSPEEYPFSLLYFTGSMNLNIVLRKAALKRGLVLNEYGFKISKANTENKALSKVPEPSTEEEIFNILGFNYIPPEHRNGTDFSEYLVN